MLISPTITDVPAPAAYKQATPIETLVTVEKVKNRVSTSSYFILTAADVLNTSLPEYYTLSSLNLASPTKPNIETQMNWVSISKKLFHQAIPLAGEELEVLNSTYKRLLSKSPTKL